MILSFAQRKSIETVHGTIGFRTGTPKLKTILRWKWDMVLTALKSLAGWKQYVRVKEDVDKEALIADHGAGRVNDGQLQKVGVAVVQEESFFVEPKIDNVEFKLWPKQK